MRSALWIRTISSFFASRFSSRVIESEHYLHDLCVYVLLNPVRAGLCDRIEDWPRSYSSYGLDAS